MSGVTVVARFVSKPEHVVRVRELLFSLLEPTRGERGCLSYRLFVDREDANCFVFVEEWASKELLDVHLAAAPLQRVLAETDGLLVGLQVSQLDVLA